MRGGPSTGLPTAPRRATSCRPAGAPTAIIRSSHLRRFIREVYIETVRAFHLFGTLPHAGCPLIDEIIGHTTESFPIPTDKACDPFSAAENT